MITRRTFFGWVGALAGAAKIPALKPPTLKVVGPPVICRNARITKTSWICVRVNGQHVYIPSYLP